MGKSVDDARAGQIMFVAHCLLNQNAKVRGIARFPAAVRPIIDLLLTDGSPVCGLKKTPMPAADSSSWGGMVWSVPEQYFAEDSGVFTDILKDEAARRNLKDILYLSFPEVDEAGRMEETLEEIRKKILMTKSE